MHIGFVNPDSPWNFLRVTRENNVKKPVEDYFTQREALVNLFNRWNNWNEEFKMVKGYKWPEKDVSISGWEVMMYLKICLIFTVC